MKFFKWSVLVVIIMVIVIMLIMMINDDNNDGGGDDNRAIYTRENKTRTFRINGTFRLK